MSGLTTQQQQSLSLAQALAAQAGAGAAAPRGDPAGPLPASNVPQDDSADVTKGALLPIDRDQSGGLHFDPTAGVLGAIGNAFTLPGDVLSGRQNLNDPSTIGRVANFATLASPTAAADRMAPLGGAARGVPTTQQLYDAGGAGFDQARGMGVSYTSQSVADAMAKAQAAMEGDGILAVNAPKTFDTLKSLQSPPEDSTALVSGLLAARQSLGRIARDARGPDGSPTTEAEAAGRAIDALDGYMGQPPPSSVVAGPAATVAQAINDANGNWSAAKRSDQLAGIEDAADLKASAANSGLNGDNAIRQRAASLLLNPKRIAGYSPDQVAALRQVVTGTATRNTLRWAGNFLGGGGGLGAALVSAGGAAGGFATGGMEAGALGAAAGPVAGAAAKTTAAWLTGRALDRVAQSVRSGAPLAAQMPDTVAGPLSANAQASAARTVVSRALANIQARQQNGPASSSSPGVSGVAAALPPGQLYDANGHPIQIY